jgi:hypothetical protein
MATPEEEVATLGHNVRHVFEFIPIKSLAAKA